MYMPRSPERAMRRNALNREIYSFMMVYSTAIQYVQYMFNTIIIGGNAMRSNENEKG